MKESSKMCVPFVFLRLKTPWSRCNRELDVDQTGQKCGTSGTMGIANREACHVVLVIQAATA